MYRRWSFLLLETPIEQFQMIRQVRGDLPKRCAQSLMRIDDPEFQNVHVQDDGTPRRFTAYEIGENHVFRAGLPQFENYCDLYFSRQQPG